MPPTMSDRTEILSGVSNNTYDDMLIIRQKQQEPTASSSSSSSSSSTTDMHEHSSSTSILATMNSFVRAVNEMDETILIPSRLQDMDSGVLSEECKSCSNALIPQMDLRKSAESPSSDLLAYYHTLNAIKTELVHGPNSDEEREDEMEDASQQEQDPSVQVAKAFRHHLQGLFGVLKQLTGSAQFLTSRYQEEIGELASGSGAGSGLSTFTL